VNVFVLQQRLVSRFVVSNVDESLSSSSLVDSASSPLCYTGTADPSVILSHLPSVNLSRGNMNQLEVKLLSSDRTVQEEAVICSDTEGSVCSIGKKASIGIENLSCEDIIRKQSSASTDTIPTFSMDVNYEVNSSESHCQLTEMQGTQSEISMSSSLDVYSSKRSSIVDPDNQLGLLEIDPVTHTVPQPCTGQENIISANGPPVEGTLPQLQQTQGLYGIDVVVDETRLEQGLRNMTITNAVHDTQFSDPSGSEGPSRKTSFIYDRVAELGDAINTPAEAQRCISEVILSSHQCAEPEQQQQHQQIDVQMSPPPFSETSTSQAAPGSSHTPNQQYTPENTIMPAVDQQAVLMHPRLSQQNSLEKDR
jgi:hypothetical protein